MPDAQAISLNRLTVRLGGQTVLRDLSLDVARGEKVVLTGPSGSGKTTVLRCVPGFVRLEGGTVRVEGEELTARTVWDVRRRLAYVAQEPQLGEGTAREVIRRPFGYRANADLTFDEARLGELFDRFRLARGVLDQPVGELSGGQKQRVAIVSALMLRRGVLLLDEPSSALDPDAREAVFAHIDEADALTVLCVAHDAASATFADRRVELSRINGRSA